MPPTMVKINTVAQGSLIRPPRAEDRNFENGGRSFYFFDMDDNIFHLNSRIYVYHSRTGEEFAVSTHDFATVAPQLGKPGNEWEHYMIQDRGHQGSFRDFRDQPGLDVDEQPFLSDFRSALEDSWVDWRGPSWDFFVHAVNNNRPIALITARGHHPFTIQRAFNLLVSSRVLDAVPNYLGIYPLSHPEIRHRLGDAQNTTSIAELKRRAIEAAVSDAFACYGRNPHHRFGMSDDDPKNLELISLAMQGLKRKHPHNAFFVINTHQRQLIKQEIDHPEQVSYDKKDIENNDLIQSDLFSNNAELMEAAKYFP